MTQVPIKGYRPLTDDEVILINRIKELEITVGHLWQEITTGMIRCDLRWASIARTHFEEGFSALVRSIARPEERF